VIFRAPREDPVIDSTYPTLTNRGRAHQSGPSTGRTVEAKGFYKPSADGCNERVGLSARRFHQSRLGPRRRTGPSGKRRCSVRLNALATLEGRALSLRHADRPDASLTPKAVKISSASRHFDLRPPQWNLLPSNGHLSRSTTARSPSFRHASDQASSLEGKSFRVRDVSPF